MAHTKAGTVQSTYDVLAEEYAQRLYGELEHKPLDRKLLDQFADRVRGIGMVCDLGCGPGQIARYLHDRGIPVCGVDLSQRMIDCARRLNPGIEFSQGDMRDLPIEDDAWAGIAAFYSIVNLPAGEVVLSLREMMRVLKPGGRLLLSFHIGEDDSHVEENLWGRGTASRAARALFVQAGDRLKPGAQLNEGSIYPHELLEIRGRTDTELYLVARSRRSTSRRAWTSTTSTSRSSSAR